MLCQILWSVLLYSAYVVNPWRLQFWILHYEIHQSNSIITITKDYIHVTTYSNSTEELSTTCPETMFTSPSERCLGSSGSMRSPNLPCIGFLSCLSHFILVAICPLQWGFGQMALHYISPHVLFRNKIETNIFHRGRLHIHGYSSDYQ